VHVTVLPAEFVAVPVNVVSDVMFGVVVEPPETGVKLPMPLSIENVEAFVTVHVSVEVPPPTGSPDGLAESVQAGAGVDPSTVMVVLQVTEPPGPVAVPVKAVLVCIIGVVVEPPETGATEPIPLSIENEVAFVVVQVSCDVPPPVRRADGAPESVQVGAAGGGAALTDTFAEHVF
jgi:hypothetical protein